MTGGPSSDSAPVAFFMPSLRGGGAERVLLDLARGVARRGYPVDVVVLNQLGAVTLDLGAGVRLVDLQRSRAAFALAPLLTYLRRDRPRVLLSTIEHTNVLAVLANRLAGRGTRVVLREANTLTADLEREGVKGRAVRLAMRAAYRDAAGIIAVSEGVKSALVTALRVGPELVEVIASPVITQRLRLGATEPVGHPWFTDDGPPLILGVGRLVEQKGFDVLIDAFARLSQQLPCRLVIVGEGPLRGELLHLASSLGVAGSVQLPGFVKNPFSYMAACDLFVLSSRWEGLPNVLIQAVAVGAKVVSTDCPSGPTEVLDGGLLGELVPVDDVAALAAAMRRALREPRPVPPAGWFDRYDEELVVGRYMRALGLPPMTLEQP